jgi:hypothetical protein
VDRVDAAVYSLAVLRLRDQPLWDDHATKSTGTQTPTWSRAGQGNPGLIAVAAFIDWMTPHVEWAEKAEVLRDRWDREASGQAGRRQFASL